VHPTAVRPGSVLEVGDLFAFAGSVAPTLPAQVTYRVHFPDGRTTRVYSGRANRIGYYYRPEDRFVCEVPGRYEVEVGVSFDGVTSAGPVEEPFPTGDVLGSTGGRFSFYVVPKDSPALPVRMPAVSTLASHTTPVDLVAGGGEAPLDQVHLTTMMPGFLLESRALALSSGGSSAAYRYDPVVLARDSSMLDVRTGLLPANANPAAGELITITLFGVNAGQHRARIVTLRGRLLMDMPVLQ
jgi:hypothetical protein